MEYNSIYNYILFLFKFRSTNTIPFFKDGNAVVTHFSGENLLPNPNGYVLKIIETKNATFQKKERIGVLQRLINQVGGHQL